MGLKPPETARAGRGAAVCTWSPFLAALTRFGFGLAAVVLTLSSARGEPVIDRALSGVQVINDKGCTRLRIGFNFRVRYLGHVPTNKGRSMTIQVRAIDPTVASAAVLLDREALRPVSTSVGEVKSIEFEVGGGKKPSLRLLFDRTLSLDAAEGADFTSIIVALRKPGAGVRCRPEFPIGTGWQTSVAAASVSRQQRSPVSRETLVTRGSGAVSAAKLRNIGATLDESRAAIKKKRYDEAIKKLRVALAAPENKHSREAQELLGTAYKKGGDLEAARAQYEDYLARYPADEDARRVRQRLMGVLTALGEPPPKLRASRDDGLNSGTHVSLSGSFSQFYLRNDSYRTLRDPSLPPEVNPDPDKHRVHQNSLLTSLDVAASWSNSFAKNKFRFSGTEDHDFSGRDPEIIGVASLYLDTSIRDYGLGFRIGRQTQSSNGILGRFDGAEVVWQATDLIRLGLVGGSPVWSRYYKPFYDEKYFYGGHLGFTPLDGLDVTIYGLEQRVSNLIDRRAVGSDLRYLNPSLSLFSTIDYDIHFNEINLALANASWTFPDKTVIYGAVDQRKSPFLTSWTALQGQPFLTLYDLLKVRSEEEIYRLAVDRAATYNSASLGLSHPFSEHWQGSLDVNWTKVSDTPASGGVPRQLGTGDEFYYSAQLIGSNLTTDRDMVIAALRFADREFTDLVVLDTQLRYPLTDDLRISPRMRLGYLTGNGIDLKEYTIQPSLLVDYTVRKDWHFEAEVGINRNERRIGPVVEKDTELFVTVGYRYDFYADDESHCSWPIFGCRERQ